MTGGDEYNENDDVMDLFQSGGYTDPDSADGASAEYGDSDETEDYELPAVEPAPPEWEENPDDTYNEPDGGTGGRDGMPRREKTQDELIAEAEPSKKGARENKARFFNRKKTIAVAMAAFVTMMLLVSLVIPAIKPKKKKKSSELEKAGSVYIPSDITGIPDPVTDKEEDIPAPAEEENFEEKFPPLIEEPQPQAARAAPAGTSGAASTAPATNRNEQQKQLSHVPLDTRTARTTPSATQSAYGGAAASGYSGSYVPAQLEANMNGYMSALQKLSGGSEGYEAQNMQGNKRDFMESGAQGGGSYQWNGLHSLWKGTVIPAVLNTGINTDLPGIVTATVTQNVYSSQDGRYLLIPQGSKLFAIYNSSISYGQNRIQVAWNTLIRPDGLEINLGNVPGVDSKGFSGYGGFVSQHPFEYAKALGLIGIFSILNTKLDNTIANSTNTYTQNMLADTYNEAQKLNNKIMERALDIQPTLYKLNGTRVNLITNVTMDIPPIEPFRAQQKYARE